MSKKRGLSLDEKRTRMLEIFYNKKDVFQLKELEKIGPAEKGIVQQSVKDVVQSLIDDGYVDSEKIGTSSYFWAFPSKATQVRKRKLEQIEEKETGVFSKTDEIVQEVKRAKLSRNETPEREEMIAKIIKLKEEQIKLIKLLDQYKDSDPLVIERERRDTKEAYDGANRWTDNIFSFRSYLKNKLSLNESDINRQFGLPDDLDYIESCAD